MLCMRLDESYSMPPSLSRYILVRYEARVSDLHPSQVAVDTEIPQVVSR